MQHSQRSGVNDEDVAVLSTAQKPAVSRHAEGAVVILSKGEKPQQVNQHDRTKPPALLKRLLSITGLWFERQKQKAKHRPAHFDGFWLPLKMETGNLLTMNRSRNHQHCLAPLETKDNPSPGHQNNHSTSQKPGSTILN